MAERYQDELRARFGNDVDLGIDPGGEVLDPGHRSCRSDRYHWTVSVFGEPEPVVAGRSGDLGEDNTCP